MKYRVRLWHGIIPLLAAVAALFFAFWPTVEYSSRLTQENLDRALNVSNRKDIEDILGPPSYTDGWDDPWPDTEGTLLTWKGKVLEQNHLVSRRIDVKLRDNDSPIWHVDCNRKPLFWEKAQVWLKEWWP